MNTRLIELLKDMDPKGGAMIFEDFLNDDGATRFTKTGSGTTAIIAGKNGVLQIDSGATDQDTKISLFAVAFAPGANPTVTAKVSCNTALPLTGSIEEIGFYKGANDYANAVINHDGSLHIMAKATAASIAASDTDTGIVLEADHWYEITTTIRQNGSVVVIVYDFETKTSTRYATAGGVASSSATVDYNLNIGINDGGANQNKLDIDYVMVRQDR